MCQTVAARLPSADTIAGLMDGGRAAVEVISCAVIRLAWMMLSLV